jgi:hypothetical protein
MIQTSKNEQPSCAAHHDEKKNASTINKTMMTMQHDANKNTTRSDTIRSEQRKSSSSSSSSSSVLFQNTTTIYSLRPGGTTKRVARTTLPSGSRRRRNTSTTSSTKSKNQQYRKEQHTPPPLVILRIFILSIGMSLFFMCCFQRSSGSSGSSTDHFLLTTTPRSSNNAGEGDLPRKEQEVAAKLHKSTAAVLTSPIPSQLNHPHSEEQDKMPPNNTHHSSSFHSTIKEEQDDDDEDDDPPFVIFYNIWIARMGEKYKNTLRIVEEQLHQIGTSYAATANNHKNSSSKNVTSTSKTTATLYYQTIGKPKTITPQFMQPLCQQYGLRCIHLGHAVQGFEEITLHHLYDFCQGTTTTTTVGDKKRRLQGRSKLAASLFPPSTKVVYLHTKGAFHNRRDGSNDRWRRHLTLAATSQHCLSYRYQRQPRQRITTTAKKNSRRSANTTADDDTSTAATCNVCGLQFYPLWTPFIIGNMWSASCSYIANLVPPKQFAQRMQDLVQYNLTSLQNRSLMHANLYKAEPWFLGLERYAAELWVGTHPDLQPCDVSVTADNEYWTRSSSSTANHEKSDDIILDEFVWSMAPRSYSENTSTSKSTAGNNNNNNLDAPWLRLDPQQRDLVLSNETLRMREFFLLPGLILKYHILYNGTYPSNSSWVWNFYPDGAEWRERLAKYGTAAAVLEQLPTPQQ